MTQKGIRRFVPENDLLDPTLAISKILEARNEIGLIFGNDFNFLIKNSIFIVGIIVFGFIFNFYIPNVLEIIMIGLAGFISVFFLIILMKFINSAIKQFSLLGLVMAFSIIFITIMLLGFL